MGFPKFTVLGTNRFELKRELLLLVAVFSSGVIAKNYSQTRLGRNRPCEGGGG